MSSGKWWLFSLGLNVLTGHIDQWAILMDMPVTVKSATTGTYGVPNARCGKTLITYLVKFVVVFLLEYIYD